MKIFFGPDVEAMITELRGQAASNVRLHVLHSIEGQELIMKVYVTALCNEQIYESVFERTESLADVPEDQVGEFVRDRCEQVRAETARRIGDFEVRAGIVGQ